MDDEFVDEFDAAETSMQTATRIVVLRHRGARVLTWALMHQIEVEVLEEVTRAGHHRREVLNMLRAPDAMTYPAMIALYRLPGTTSSLSCSAK